MYATAKPIKQLKEMDPAVLGFTPLTSIEPNHVYLLKQIIHFLGDFEYETVRRKFLASGEWTGMAAMAGAHLVDSNSIIAWLLRGGDHE